MSKRLKIILMMLAGMTLLVSAIAYKNKIEMERTLSQGRPPAAVRVAVVTPDKWQQKTFAVGTIAAEQGVDVTAPLPGTVVNINFNSGDQVNLGDTLLSLDTGIQNAELSGLIAALSLKEVQFQRAAQLLEKQQISQSDFDYAKAEKDEATALVAAKQAFIDRKTVYAPFSGELGIRLVNLGTYMEPGDPIVSLQMLSPIHVDFAIPERELGQVEIGQTVEFKVRAFPGKTYEAKIATIEPNVQIGSRSVRVRASLENKEGQLKPGMFAETWVIKREKKEVLKVPRTAVTFSPFGQIVFVVVSKDGSSFVERRQVTAGEINGSAVGLDSGVSEGDIVVATGQNKLRNGMSVVVTETETDY
jgi:membrane fusion protein (multidrug efflux system)